MSKFFKYWIVAVLLFYTSESLLAQFFEDKSPEAGDNYNLVKSAKDSKDNIYLIYSNPKERKTKVFKYNGVFHVPYKTVEFVESIGDLVIYKDEILFLGRLEKDYLLYHWKDGNWGKTKLVHVVGNEEDQIPNISLFRDGVYLFASGFVKFGTQSITDKLLVYSAGTWVNERIEIPNIVHKTAFWNDTLYIQGRESSAMPYSIYKISVNKVVTNEGEGELINATQNYLFYKKQKIEIYKRSKLGTTNISNLLSQVNLNDLLMVKEKNDKFLYYGYGKQFSIFNEDLVKSINYTNFQENLNLFVTDSGYYASSYSLSNFKESLAEIKWNHHKIEGVLYNDLNKNNFFDMDVEPVLKNKTFTIANRTVTSNNGGKYSISIPAGTKGKFDMALDYVYSASNMQDSLFEAFEDSLQNINLDYNMSAATRDVAARISLDGARHGYTSTGSFILEYRGLQESGVDVEIQVDSRISNFSSSTIPAPVDNKIVWKDVEGKPNETVYFPFTYTVDTSQLKRGDTIVFIVRLPGNTDLLPNNDIDTAMRVVTAAYDPNYKQSFPVDSILTNLSKIDYIVHFQNLGDDTAITVTVVDTLMRRFPINKVEVTGTSHPDVYSKNVVGNTIIWQFRNIYLVDSATNEPESKGWINFTVYFKDTFAIGDVVKNRAHIYFDYQDPVATNYAILKRYKFIPKVFNNNGLNIEVLPNPVNQILKITNNEITDQEITMYDVAGKLVLSKECISKVTTTIDLINLSQGIYFLRSNGKYLGKLVKSE